MREGFLISIPSRGRTREEYRAARQRMKQFGLDDRQNQFATREDAESALRRYHDKMPADARIVKFMNL